VLDIASVPGVTAAEAASLAALSLHSTADLLRTNRAELLRRLPGLSLPRVLGWQAFAELAEIDDITPAAVAAFRTAGADGLAEFAGWTPTRAGAAFPAASADQIAAWQKDAVRLLHTGVLNGTVTLRDGTPVEGAEVIVYGETAATDARGRFRVARLALDGRFAVTLHHPALGHRLVTGVRASRSSALIGRTFTLVGRAQPRKVLSELTGDRLPPIGSAPITTRSIDTAPAAADILLLIDRYADGDGRVASRFLDFEGGRFVRRTYRIPAADLPAGVQSGDDIVQRGGVWVAGPHSARQIERVVRLRAARRALPPPPTSVTEARRQVRTIAEAMSDPRGGAH
jgi:hypothetical protein